MKQVKKNYNDIINHPHHQSAKRKHMSIYNRAAQFSPFAALTGYEDAIYETSRLTNEMPELDETEKIRINEILLFIKNNLTKKLEVKISYFENDNKKSGGSIFTKKCFVKKINEDEKSIYLCDDSRIPINYIINIIVINTID